MTIPVRVLAIRYHLGATVAYGVVAGDAEVAFAVDPSLARRLEAALDAGAGPDVWIEPWAPVWPSGGHDRPSRVWPVTSARLDDRRRLPFPETGDA